LHKATLSEVISTLVYILKEYPNNINEETIKGIKGDPKIKG
jgi:hypothetical protein